MFPSLKSFYLVGLILSFQVLAMNNYGLANRMNQDPQETKTEVKTQQPIKPVNIKEQIKASQLPSRLDGIARLLMKPVPDENKQLFRYEIFIDLSEVVVIVQETEKFHAVLGAYALGVEFDQTKMQLVEVKGGQTPEFTSSPFFTNPEKSNSTGLVKFTAVHTQQQSPTGIISVAVVEFRAIDSAKPKEPALAGDSLSTSIRKYPGGKIVGPFSIPFKGKHLQKQTTPRTIK